jgi:hypothetical protein
MEKVFGEKATRWPATWAMALKQIDLNTVHTQNGGRVVPPGWSKATFEAYREAMVNNYGEERAGSNHRRRPTSFSHFPNLIFILNQFRVIQPVSVDRTVIYYYPTLLEGAPDEINQRRLIETYLVHGPAARVAPDDFEACERNQYGFQARLYEWLVLRRGLHRERRDNGSLAGHETDETTQRGIWKPL